MILTLSDNILLKCRFCRMAFEKQIASNARLPIVLTCGFGHRWESSGRVFISARNCFVETFSCVNPEVSGFPSVEVVLDFREV